MGAAAAQFRSLFRASGNSMPAASLQSETRSLSDSLPPRLLCRLAQTAGFAGGWRPAELRVAVEARFIAAAAPCLFCPSRLCSQPSIGKTQRSIVGRHQISPTVPP